MLSWPPDRGNPVWLSGAVRWAVTNSELAPNSVYELAIRTDAVGRSHVEEQLVNAEKIAPGTVAAPVLGLEWTGVSAVGTVEIQSSLRLTVDCPYGLEPVSPGWELDWGLQLNGVRLSDTDVAFRVINPTNAVLDYEVIAYCADVR